MNKAPARKPPLVRHDARMAGYGAHLQLDRQGAHRPRVVPDKRREQNRRACRSRGGD